MSFLSFSIILNIILLCLLGLLFFFKNAVNDWLVQKMKGKEDKNKEEREILKKLRNLLMEYQSVIGLYPLHLMVYFRGNAESIKFIEPYFRDSGEKHESINKQLLELKPDLDKETRERLTVLMTEMSNLTISAAGEKFQQFVSGFQKMDLNEFTAAMVKTQQSCSNFISDIEKIINK